MMKTIYCFIFCWFALLLTACNTVKSDNKVGDSTLTAQNEVKIDTSKSFKIGNYWATPKEFFDFNTLESYTGDTLKLVTCDKSTCYPFGKIENKQQFKTSLLSNFSVVSKVDTMDTGAEEFQTLKFKSSKLLYYFDNDPEASTHSYILKGEIYDPEVRFDKNIRIGMNQVAFYNTFFDYFPKQLSYKVVMLIFCVDDIKHIYSFKNNRLQSVAFVNNTYWKVDY